MFEDSGNTDMQGRVGRDVAIPTPHRTGRADFRHPVPHGRASLAAIRCRFVDRFARLKVLSCFLTTVLSSRRLPSLDRVPARAVPRRPQYYEGRAILSLT